VTGRISKIGDAGVRTALYEAANVILTRTRKGSSLKKWAMGVAKRAGMRKVRIPTKPPGYTEHFPRTVPI
jgi:transposase